jgi:hypothetical protein
VVVVVVVVELLAFMSVLEPVAPVAEPEAPIVVPEPVVDVSVEPGVVPAVALLSVEGVVGAVLGSVLAVLEEDDVSVLLVVGAGVVVEVVEVSVVVSRWQADSDRAAIRARAAQRARGFVFIRTLLEQL